MGRTTEAHALLDFGVGDEPRERYPCPRCGADAKRGVLPGVVVDYHREVHESRGVCLMCGAAFGYLELMDLRAEADRRERRRRLALEDDRRFVDDGRPARPPDR